ncbi:hypothetical protein DRH14_01980 [Candidatus Shapirobacteria bacterium]|nr:MAG: hypothetical protein DRH14_01980 [Candidatus Shapirobacteria bacterium]
MLKKINFLIFIVILSLTFFLRFYKLNQLPPSLNWDEISHGYNAYSILKTGRDQWGTKYPLFNFRAYGDYPTTLNLYLSIPLIKLFGLDVWTTRFPSAFLSVLITIPLYFLAKLFFKKQKSVFLFLVLNSLSPWSLFPGRAVFQSTVASFFFISGLTALAYSLKKQSAPLSLISAIALGLSQYSYHNTRLIVPILIPTILFIYKNLSFNLYRKNKKITILAILIFAFLTIAQIINLTSPSSQARSRWTFLLNPDAINLINFHRGQSHLSPFLARLAHNKVTYFVPRFLNNYLNFLNPYLLFFEGTGNHQFNLPHTGILFSVCLPFFYLSFVKFFKLPKQSKLVFLSYFLISLLPSAITYGDFPIIRAMSLLPLPYLMITAGLEQLSLAFWPFVLVLIFQFQTYWHQYNHNYPIHNSQSWQYGYRQAIEYVKNNYSNYQHIILTKKYGEPHQFILFYWPWDPASFQQDPKLKWDYHASWYWVDAFDKFQFINDWQIKQQKISPSSLLITSPNNYPKPNSKLIKTINFLDGQPAFDIIAYD